MHPALLAFATAAIGGGILPLLGSVAVSSSNSGACDVGFGGAHDAQVLIAWSVANPDDLDYEVKLYENGVLLSTQSTTNTGYVKTVTGAVEDGAAGTGPAGRWNANWTYRLDLVRLSDSVVMQSQTSTAWTQTYNVCTS